MLATARSVPRARLAFVAGAWLFVGCVVVQVFLVGLDIFAGQGGEIHRDFAYLYGWLAPILVLVGEAARIPRRTRWLSLTLLVLFAAQTVLPSLHTQYPAIAALHPVNALAIFGLSIVIAREATAAVRDDVASARDLSRSAQS